MIAEVPLEMLRIAREGDVALIEVDHPPVNALSQAVRAALLAALADAAAQPAVRAIVLAGAGRCFVAGADIREFDAPPVEPSTRAVAQAIEDCAKPVVAALHGTTLGGGFELALACHARAIAPDGVVGLPEVRIGLIPGAGGTQRTPRLAGLPVALDLVTTGRHVPAAEALALGLVDEVATDPRVAAFARARALADAGSWRRTGALPVPWADGMAFDEAVAAVEAKARGAIAPARAAAAVVMARDTPLMEALDREQAVSLELRRGPQSRALRHIFHAERVASRLPVVASARPLAQVGVVGGGTMGSGIALALIEAGLTAVLAEVSDGAAAAALARVQAVLDRQVKAGRLRASSRAERLARLHVVTNLAALAPCDLVIEAVTEDLAEKQRVFRALSAVVRRDAVLASNTSYLDIDLLADVVDAPERVLGLHFFSPAHVMRLLEVVRAPRTAPETLATGLALAKRLKKVAVICGVCDGFIGNRILMRWRMQCEYALEDGALPGQVDAAIEALGFPMGPFAVADMSGLDIGWATRKRLAATRDPHLRYVPVADWICEQGRFGQKTGAGWYIHDHGRRLPDPAVAALIERASAARGIARREVTAGEIQRHVLAAMVNEGARILAEGIAVRPSDIDVVLVHGYGYPAWRGGPMHEADETGLASVLAEVEALHAASGAGWEPAPLLRELAAAGRRFGDLNT